MFGITLAFLAEGTFWFLSILIIITNLVACGTMIFLERRNPQIIAAWLLLMAFLPVFGFLIYIVFGRHLYGEHIFSKKTKADEIFSQIADDQYRKTLAKQMDLSQSVERFDTTIALLLNQNQAAYSSNNSVDIYITGEEKFAAFKEALLSAKDHIHLEYYIIRDDELGNEIMEILTEKAKSGVKVRVIFDAVGVHSIKKTFYDNLKNAGGDVRIFFPLKIRRLNVRINFRNHRKILVVDGKVGFIGGFNIGDEYLGKGPLGYWRDTHVKLCGGAVAGLQTRFIMDWNYAAKNAQIEVVDRYPYYPIDDILYPYGSSGVQIASSGPDSSGKAIYSGFVSLIGRARNSIYIQTPYFIPDETITTALLLAIKSGVDVRIEIPCKPDHPFVYWASYSYMGDLIRAGAKGYTYDKGFIHSKVAIIDGIVSTIGTANWDIRSFKLNFETNAFIYDEEVGQAMNQVILEELEKDCTLVTVEAYNNRSYRIKFKEGICRLVSPLL